LGLRRGDAFQTSTSATPNYQIIIVRPVESDGKAKDSKG